MILRISILLFVTFISFSCTEVSDEKIGFTSESINFSITNLTDEEYPDNPDIGYRSKEYMNDFFDSGKIIKIDSNHYSFAFYSKSEMNDTIKVENIFLDEFMPTVPSHIHDDEYLKCISIVNQEWNRNQVRFNANEFVSTDSKLVRIDIARNCLNAYLWEIIAYCEEEGNIVPIYHGWFDFPHDLYGELFEERNHITYEEFKKPLENWEDPENKTIDNDKLREVISLINTSFEDKSNEMYPLEAARKKKFKEIIYPTSFSTMKDLQTDSSLFATFTPPGFYNRADPRTTELGRFFQLDSVSLNLNRSKANSDSVHELKLTFTDKDGNRITNLLFGGLDFNQFPSLLAEEANKGWKSSMGIGNHTFYETYEEHQKVKSTNNPYYGYLTDESNNWIDSHKVGIDGPIFHFDKEDQSILHLWLLSFERHALIGHYKIKINQ